MEGSIPMAVRRICCTGPGMAYHHISEPRTWHKLSQLYDIYVDGILLQQ